jgi:hypothetical protein
MKHFKFTLPDELVRTMNRQQYKAAMHWLRFRKVSPTLYRTEQAFI